MKKYYLESRRRGIFYMKKSKRKANWIGHILYRGCILQQATEGKIKGGITVSGNMEEDVGSYWMTAKKGEDTLI
jgi:hypothetical protein